MPETVDTVVVGAGQAGLSTSYFLSQRGRPHLVLEQGEVAETWRSKRWDDFVLNTPNWGQLLPGFHYSGPEPDAFAPLGEVIAYLEDYAAAIEAPVRTTSRVTAVRRDDGGFAIEAGGEELRAGNVVIAAGAFQRPHVPAVAFDAAPSLFQLHSSEYRRPDQLPPGGVLIVGSGQSGCQIADDLVTAGRRTYLAVGRCPWLPRRMLGKDILHWLFELGLADQTADALPSPSARLGCNPAVSGNDGGHDCNPRTLAARGTVLTGRVASLEGTRVAFAPDLHENLAKADAFVAGLRRQAAEHEGVHPEQEEPPAEIPDPPAELDLGAAGIGTILWATGYRHDHGWIEGLATDRDGWPVQERGVTRLPGLYFVGLNWLHKRKSALFSGVGEDAEHVVARLDATRPRS